MPTRDQERASIAFECVTTRQTQTPRWKPEECKEYTNTARATSALIRASGLTQALEFIATRSKDTQKAILEDLGRVVLRDQPNVTSQTGTELKKQSREKQLSEYMLLTRETLACVQWLARFGKSVLEV